MHPRTATLAAYRRIRVVVHDTTVSGRAFRGTGTVRTVRIWVPVAPLRAPVRHIGIPVRLIPGPTIAGRVLVTTDGTVHLRTGEFGTSNHSQTATSTSVPTQVVTIVKAIRSTTPARRLLTANIDVITAPVMSLTEGAPGPERHATNSRSSS